MGSVEQLNNRFNCSHSHAQPLAVQCSSRQYMQFYSSERIHVRREEEPIRVEKKKMKTRKKRNDDLGLPLAGRAPLKEAV